MPRRCRSSWRKSRIDVAHHTGGRFSSCVALLVVAAWAFAGCRDKPPVEALKLEGNLLTVDNRSSRDWTGVEIWLNKYYRVTTAVIPAGGRSQVPLDAFVGGFGRRFDFHHAMITDLRLTAKLPDGTPLELKKEFTVGGLQGALGRKR